MIDQNDGFDESDRPKETPENPDQPKETPTKTRTTQRTRLGRSGLMVGK